jgi:hypothetical protein
MTYDLARALRLITPLFVEMTHGSYTVGAAVVVVVGSVVVVTGRAVVVGANVVVGVTVLVMTGVVDGRREFK